MIVQVAVMFKFSQFRIIRPGCLDRSVNTQVPQQLNEQSHDILWQSVQVLLNTLFYCHIPHPALTLLQNIALYCKKSNHTLFFFTFLFLYSLENTEKVIILKK